MNDIYNKYSLTGIAGALALGMGIDVPERAETPNPQLVRLVRDRASNGTIDRVFMYNPDAVSMWFYQKYTDLFDAAVAHTQLFLPLQCVMPSVTPVCFGTFYTGAQPEVHGIRRYEKPIIRTDTLFDAAIRAGKRIALIAEDDCSMAKIFLERDMDYFIYDEEDAINEKALELIDRDEYDLILCYNGNYDTVMHKNGTEAEVSVNALKYDVAWFDRFANRIREKWQAHDTLIGFAMDHGSHDIDGGCGSHGLDMPEDLNIFHLYGVLPRQN